MSKHWYVIHAHSGFEKKVKEAILEQAKNKGLEDRIENILIPAEEVVDIKRGKKNIRERKFFPGYILIKMEINDAVQHLIKNTPKVSGFLGNDKKPSPIPDAAAADMVAKITENLEKPRQSILFQIGEQVRVSDGPFASCNGCVEEVDAERSRLKVSVSLFGRATPVELEYGQVEKF